MIAGLIPILGEIIDKVIPDVDKKIELKLELAKLEHDLMKSQVDVNKVEASHKSIFVAGWRPMCGWIGAVGLGYSFILEPFMSWTARVVFKYGGSFPSLETGDLMWLVAGMLGFGTVRAVEKIKGVAREESPIAAPPSVPASPPAPKKKKGVDLWPF